MRKCCSFKEGCNLDCQFGKDNRNRIVDGRKLPRTECCFYHFLITKGLKLGDNFEMQATVDKCPFTKSNGHKVDFHIIRNCKGEDVDLYIEVKGYLSYSSVNQLKWLVSYISRHVYVLEMTNEDWMGRCLEKETGNDKCQRDIKRQFGEIMRIIENPLVELPRLQKRMEERLREYENVRSKDIEEWEKVVNESAKRREIVNDVVLKVSRKVKN